MVCAVLSFVVMLHTHFAALFQLFQDIWVSCYQELSLIGVDQEAKCRLRLNAYAFFTNSFFTGEMLGFYHPLTVVEALI